MDRRKWEDLNSDCLVNVFGRLGVESLLLDVPLVCKSWYKATLTPMCWQRLVFPRDILDSRLADAYQVNGYFNANGIVKFVVSRSQRSATTLVLPSYCSKEDLIYVAEECPSLKCLVLPPDLAYDHQHIIPSLISKWKSLETLNLGSNFIMDEVLPQISLHCKKFVGLCQGSYISKERASAIVASLPKIKYLILRKAYVEREGLVMILKGCKELVQLDVRDCIGFDDDDEEMIKLASNINNFRCEGSRAYDDDDYYEGHISHDDSVYGDLLSD